MTFTIWHILGASGIVAILVAVIATIRTRHQDIKKVAYMMDALEDGELNFRFQDKNKYARKKQKCLFFSLNCHPEKCRKINRTVYQQADNRKCPDMGIL